MGHFFPNTNAQWCSVVVETLFRKGLKQAVVCMGSRSSPLTFAFANRSGIETFPVLDERSAGFFALGLAKRSKVPVALICTSGTAAANFLPAVIEASESGVPLIVLTADRPWELRNCRAGQTIDQVKLYGGYVRDFVEYALPENSLKLLRYARQRTSALFDHSMGCRPGPVHANMPFREPLSWELEDEFEVVIDSAEDFCSSVSAYLEKPQTGNGSLDLESFCSVDEGLIVVGPADPTDPSKWLENLSDFANRTNWPVLADALNPIRGAASRFANLVTTYDLIARSEAAKKLLTPKRIVIVEDFPTSKALRNWIQSAEPEALSLSSSSVSIDPTHSRTETNQHDLSKSTIKAQVQEESAFSRSWIEANRYCESELHRKLEANETLFEGKVSALIGEELSACDLFVSNSMPPRDLESFRRENDQGLRVWYSRGANGIDGILSTAIGVAKGSEKAYLLTGDLALLHDANGALLQKVCELGLTVILVNNDGGGIFEMLPVAQFEPTFERFFGAPHGIDFEKWSKAMGMTYVSIATWEQFRDCLHDSWSSGIRILEIKTNRKADAATRKAWFSEVSKKLDQYFKGSD